MGAPTGIWIPRGTRINALDLPHAEACEGPLGVLSAGFPRRSFTGQHRIPALATAGCRVVEADFPDAGRPRSAEHVEDRPDGRNIAGICCLLTLPEEESVQIGGSDIGLGAAPQRAVEGSKRVHGGIGGQSSPYSARDRPHSDVDRASEHVNRMPCSTDDPYVARADDAEQEYGILANGLRIRSEEADVTPGMFPCPWSSLPHRTPGITPFPCPGSSKQGCTWS